MALLPASPRAALIGAAISGVGSAFGIHGAIAAAVSSGSDGQQQLYNGLIVTLGGVVIAAITGYFGLLISRSRQPATDVSGDELTRKETVIARLGAENVALRAELDDALAKIRRLESNARRREPR